MHRDAELAACVERSVFREDVKIEDRSLELPVRLVRGASGVRARFGDHGGPTLIPERDEIAIALGGVPGAGGRHRDGAHRCLAAPRHGYEIAEAFTPYEVNLAAHVHLDKGCYTGQETLQRLFTYDGVRRQLVRFSGPGPAPALQDLSSPGETVGCLTSVVAEGDAWAALAVVRVDAIESGAAIALGDGTPLLAPFAFERSRALGRG